MVLGASERREDILIALDAGATINGLVSGLSEAELSMVQIWASGQERYSASTRVGGDGRFELVGAPVGPLTVHASVGNMLTGSSRDTTVQTIVPEGALDIPVEVVFETGFVLSGLVTRAGEPAGQVWVRANSEGTGPHSGSASTDASGAYSIDGLPPGAYRVSSGTFRETVEISGHTTYDIELPTSTVTGQVVEAGPQSPPDGRGGLAPGGGHLVVQPAWRCDDGFERQLHDGGSHAGTVHAGRRAGPASASRLSASMSRTARPRTCSWSSTGRKGSACGFATACSGFRSAA